MLITRPTNLLISGWHAREKIINGVEISRLFGCICFDGALQEIWMAETKKDVLAAFDAFIETWGVKYDKAVK
jgi:hypothetical protein